MPDPVVLTLADTLEDEPSLPDDLADDAAEAAEDAADAAEDAADAAEARGVLGTLITAAFYEVRTRHLVVAALVGHARETIDHGGWTPFVEQHLPFGIRTAQMYVEINEAFGGASNTQDLARLPVRLTSLHAAAKLKLEDADTWARVAPSISPDMTLEEINALVDPFGPAPEPPSTPAPAQRGGAAPRREKQKSQALGDAERTIHSLNQDLARERETLRALILEGLFVRSLVTCTLCKHEHSVKDVRKDWRDRPAQEDITAWIQTHLREAHADDDVCVRYVLERFEPPVPELLTEEQKAAARALFRPDDVAVREGYDPQGFAACFARKMLPPVPAEGEVIPEPNDT
jgi:hypothetical protein